MHVLRVLCSYRMVNCCTENDTQELYERTKKKAKFDTELYERTKKRAMNEGKEKKILNKKPKIVIDLTKDKKKYKPIEYWLDLEIYKSEKKILVEGGWLSDNVITAVQTLLKKYHPLIGGLQPTILTETLNFEVQRGEFVQVLNVHSSHWITVSNLFCPPGVINIYDSMPNCELHSSTKRQIASILMTNEKSIEVQFVNMQIQSGASDCGPFATSLCASVNPAQLKYIQHDFRSHLFKCLENRKIIPFPSRQRKKSARIRGYARIEVHCSLNMVRCYPAIPALRGFTRIV